MKLILKLILSLSLFLNLIKSVKLNNSEKGYRWQQQGMTFTNGKYCPQVPYGTPASKYSLDQLKSTGANFVSLIVTQYQDNMNSTNIFPLYTPIVSDYYTYVTETDDQLTEMITYSKEIGLQVMLKLQIDLINDDDNWRGDIGYYFNETQWDQWFQSYGDALLGYARLAQRLDVEQFSMGCELIATSPQDRRWRKLVNETREVFTGTIIDSANWGYLDSRGGEDTHKTWWDAVDIIGIDAYYEICKNITNPTVEQLVEGWQPVVQRFRNLTETFNRPILMSEIGFCSGECNRGQTVTPIDFIEQAIHYEAAFKAFSDLDFPFYGFFWWTWNTDPSSGGLKDECITPQRKPAEIVVRENYGGWEILPDWPEEAQCPCTV